MVVLLWMSVAAVWCTSFRVAHYRRCRHCRRCVRYYSHRRCRLLVSVSKAHTADARLLLTLCTGNNCQITRHHTFNESYLQWSHCRGFHRRCSTLSCQLMINLGGRATRELLERYCGILKSSTLFSSIATGGIWDHFIIIHQMASWVLAQAGQTG